MRSAHDSGGTPRPGGSFQLHVARRHVDLLRVSSALCPETLPAR
ncbi:putative leader peptide [Streptomyces sp. NPDC008139]